MTTTTAPRHTVSRSARALARGAGHGSSVRLRESRPQEPRPAAPRDLPRQLSATRTGPRAAEPVPAERTDLGETYLLAQAVRRVAVTPRLWRPAIRFEAQSPCAVRIPGPKGVDVWLRTWLPGQHTGLVDLGACATAFAVVQGALDDVRADDVLGTWLTHLPTQSVRIIEPGVVHDLRGGVEGHTVSIHAYSPRLRSITEHSWDGGRLERVRTVPVAAPWQDPRVASA